MMTDWLKWIAAHQTTLGWLALTSALMFIFSLILVPVVVAKIPNDYFAHQRRPQARWATQHLAIRAIIIVTKNAAGVLLIASGLVMLILPGQGILSMIVGLTLLDFPGKFRLERWLISRRPVLRSINWLRQRLHQKPLVVDE